jgi:general secretion pathway protein K
MNERFPARARNDEGYALIAALAAMVAFSLLAFEVLAATRGNIAQAGAEGERAKLEAAADAGLARAIAGLDAGDAASRWAIDGRTRTLSVDGIAVTVRIEDERGKLPVNLISEDQFRALLEDAGASGDRLAHAVDTFEDWIDDDDDRRTLGAEAGDYAGTGVAPRNGPVRTPDELMSVAGIDSALYRKIAPSLTVFFGESGGFSPTTADPLALAVISGGGMNSPQVLERQRELAGERPAIEIGEDKPLTGRIVTVAVTADDGSNGRFTRRTFVELTGNDSEPFWIRWVQG